MNDSTDGDDAGASHVVTAFLRNGAEVLLLRRSDVVGTYAGQWGGVSGFAEGRPDEQVRTEIREETGLADGVAFVRSGRPVTFEDDELGREWIVHPFLFECDSRAVELSDEHDECEWVHPTAIVDSTDDRTTVPRLWTAYERVAPTVRTIAADDERGAAALSIRALEVLRDRAGVLLAERAELGVDPAGEWDELAELAGRLLEARPSMAVLRNRVNRTMADATDRNADETDANDAADAAATAAPADAADVLASALSGIERALAADDDAAAAAGDRLEGSVLTLSRSGTVRSALRAGEPSRIFVAESRPAGEGTAVAESFADDDGIGCPVTLHADAAAAHVLATADVDRVVVGADTVLPDGSVVNKTGTRGVAVAAAREGVPVTVVAATDKLSTRDAVNLESGDRSAIYDGDAAIDVANPTFDVTPADCVTELVTERGALETDDVTAVVDELRELEGWRDR
ncbi:NUDIX domain-containing protein [Natrarchaeobius oligotrophus]|uniref:NUDIX domain-containing protein n=1 Tax=Natrarchaeobius chitinivorans TaxID=1679083 RepID=A0A3N6MKU7_NATCH|nr:NUDIX domain-containing protein [Natrarchaeobius chitinivorans]RQH02035.1 NUDIX domain-containing protein [Natrarchaeobius chitinivorans]